MSRIEVVDKESGAILFKKDKDGRELDRALKRIDTLEAKVAKLEKAINKLTKDNK